MYTNSYKAAGMSVINQRDLETNTLVKAASRLNRIKENWGELADKELDDALEHNRKLWTILASEMADIDHPLPHELRESIASLAMFIFKHTIKVMADKARTAKDIDILININMNVAKGLSEGRQNEKAAVEAEVQADQQQLLQQQAEEAQKQQEEKPDNDSNGGDDDGDSPPMISNIIA